VDEDGDNDADDSAVPRLHLTKRDQHAHTLEDMFDFDRAPSSGTPITPVLAPAQDCTPK
jgi:hypothetical protein